MRTPTMRTTVTERTDSPWTWRAPSWWGEPCTGGVPFAAAGLPPPAAAAAAARRVAVTTALSPVAVPGAPGATRRPGTVSGQSWTTVFPTPVSVP
ncbi:hypothetical protein TNIN_140481 [Trichonephila inaurata madagascariensis]|uniref:Uncharacterized protein n=1 Tax=Trichonephila inaurata madagascariensis TaxID=2747483 RepID=A0A8X6Y784_9ARAC|nr:hypothetical protein TNIN_140481 [Trichonephila inaurata madagascariensis]